ncbi:MAG: DUF3791 domain-containing protein [Prevotellaceae bacterium]|jgi:hypothetical protein|nr:DUF3791 domain-containing protein [Prevotellaceae bacterium]
MKTQEHTIQQFVIFCLESYKADRTISGAKALSDFEECDVFSYLSEGYEVLHTQGQAYIVADIKDYIQHRKQQYS